VAHGGWPREVKAGQGWLTYLEAIGLPLRAKTDRSVRPTGATVCFGGADTLVRVAQLGANPFKNRQLLKDFEKTLENREEALAALKVAIQLDKSFKEGA